MRCRHCDYSLWNLKTRTCPECGEPYKPSDFEFERGAAMFLCPYCAQSYYGTDHRGHLVPPQFDCVSCHAAVDMDQMSVVPAQGVPEDRVVRHGVPWVHRQRRGWFRSWFATTRLALFHPERLLAGLPASASPWPAWWFAVVTHAMIAALAVAPIADIALVSAAVRGAPSGVVLSVLLNLAAVWLVGFVASVGVTGLWAVLVHLILWMSGPRQGSLGRTCQAICYAGGGNVASAIPCIGWYFGWVWWVISAVFMVRAAQRVSGVRASIAVIGPVVVLVGVLFLAWIGLVVMTMSLAARRPVGATTFAASDTRQVDAINAALLSASRGSEPPDHALELLIRSGRSYLTPPGGGMAPFCHANSATFPEEIPVGDGTLADLLAMSEAEQRSIVEEVAGAMPEGVIAHRVGDYVFTYHGADLNQPVALLWTVVMLPDPDAGFAIGPYDPVVLGTADGASEIVLYGELQRRVPDQNRLRTGLGLPPLPDLTTVTHDKPAR